MSYNHLRRYRRRSTLTQNQVAFLLGIENRVEVGRYERLMYLPKLQTALAYQHVFDIPVHELFPRQFEEAGNLVSERSLQLLQELKSAPDHRALRFKVKSLNNIQQRL